MQVVAQSIDDILAALQPLTVDWQDDISRRVIGEIEKMPVKKLYSAADVQTILDKNFDDGLLICRLFLGLSRDSFATALRTAVREAGIGVTGYRANKSAFIDALVSPGGNGKTICGRSFSSRMPVTSRVSTLLQCRLSSKRICVS